MILSPGTTFGNANVGQMRQLIKDLAKNSKVDAGALTKVFKAQGLLDASSLRILQTQPGHMTEALKNTPLTSALNILA